MADTVSIKVLGSGCANCQRLEALAQEVVGERAEDELEEGEREHVRGDEDCCPHGRHSDVVRDGRQNRRDDPVVGHHDEPGEPEAQNERRGLCAGEHLDRLAAHLAARAVVIQVVTSDLEGIRPADLTTSSTTSPGVAITP